MAPNKEKKYVSDNAQLLAEWDWEKNKGLSPQTISYGSAIKVWWKCSVCGHSWQTGVYVRGANGCGCPECAKKERGLSKKKSSAQKNSFLEKFPVIAKEWHPTKNADYDIENIAAYSNIRAWWLCSVCGNEWQTTVNHRTKEGNGCPVCSRIKGSAQKVKTHAQRSSFAILRPEEAREWHPYRNGELTPTDVSVKSNKKVWWLCDYCGYEWQTTVSHRSAGQGCPSCSKAQTSFAEQAVFYYISQVFPDAINRYKFTHEFDIYIPSKKIAVEYDGYFYHCGAKKLEQDNTKDRFCKENGITLFRFRSARLEDTESAVRITCDERKIKEGIQEFLRIVRVMDTLDIDIIRDTGKIQQQFRQIQKENSIANKSPELLKEWHLWKNGKIKPYAVAFSSAVKFWWQCSTCGYEWQDTPNHRNGRGSGCPLCVGRVVVAGINDLATLYPDIAEEWNYEKNGNQTPQTTAGKSNKKVWWKCKKHGHEWQAVISERSREGHRTSCPYCGNKKVLAGFNDLATTSPQLYKEWNWEKNEIKPTEIAAGSHKKVWWKCPTCQYEWQAVVYSRKHCGCPRCGGKVKQTTDESPWEEFL